MYCTSRSRSSRSFMASPDRQLARFGGIHEPFTKMSSGRLLLPESGGGTMVNGGRRVFDTGGTDSGADDDGGGMDADVDPRSGSCGSLGIVMIGFSGASSAARRSHFEIHPE